LARLPAARTLKAMESEWLRVVEFRHSPSRPTAATTDLYSAAVIDRITHSGNAILATNVAAAVVFEDPRGMRLAKASRSRNAAKIDLAVAWRNTSTTPTHWPPVVDDLLTRKPHLANRPAVGEIGQGPHLRRRVALTLPRFCSNEPVRREHG
jgi:hypothetical protein